MGCKPVAKSILHEIDLDRHEWNKNDQSNWFHRNNLQTYCVSVWNISHHTFLA